jgi:hypothetical protein
MSLWLAVIAVLVLGVAATAYLWNIRRRQDATAAGIAALSAMRWREFSHFVLDAMRHRGYDLLTPQDEAERGQQAEFLLSGHGRRWLLGCKHGSAYRLSPQAVAEFAANMRFQGAVGGFLVTPGHIEADARRPAREANIELIDGDALWPEVAPLLPQSLTDEVQRVADAQAKRQVAFSWLAALGVGVVLGVFALTSEPASVDAPPVVVARSPVASAPPPTPGSLPVQSAEPVGPADDDAAEDLQRKEVAGILASLPGIESAIWSTRSTLLVNLADGRSDRLAEICAALERYDALRTARVQLQPPAGSEVRVRFVQCRTF